MAKQLGTPYTRGNSDVITNYKFAGSALATGTVVGLDTNGNLVQASATVVAKGIAGYNELGYQSVVESGKSVYVKMANDAEPNINSPVYFIPTTGIITEVATNNTALNAVFMSNLTDADGGGKCAAIDFVGGL